MASISSAGNSSSSSCSSPAPVKLVSYRAANSPAVTESTECPLKRKAPDSMSDYETSKCPRGYCSHWEREFPWLRYDAATDKMWCDVCREYQESLKNRTHASNGFIRGSDLWKKTYVRDHQSSACHKACMESKATKEKPHTRPFAVYQRKMNDEQQERYNCLFNTAFHVAKRNTSFREFEFLCKLQVKNGANMGTNYQNGKACAMFIRSIAAVQRQEASEIISKSRFIAVMADGSTDRTMAEQEAIFIRYVCQGEPTNRFVALVELTSGSAIGVVEAIDNALDLVGINMEEQRNKVVNLNLDGASVNMDIYNGVAAKLQQRLGPHLTKVHCINHQLELSILDVRKDSTYLGTFESTLKVSL